LIVRTAQWVLRICVGLALILGILFWTSNAADSLILVHMGLGILVVLSLWTLGFAQALTKEGNWGLAIGAVGLSALGLGERMGGRSRHRRVPAMS
jgi:hypothetical protein